MSTACLIGRPTGPAAMKAVYCHWDGNPSAMVPGRAAKTSQMEGPRPSAVDAPSTW